MNDHAAAPAQLIITTWGRLAASSGAFCPPCGESGATFMGERKKEGKSGVRMKRGTKKGVFEGVRRKPPKSLQAAVNADT